MGLKHGGPTWMADGSAPRPNPAPTAPIFLDASFQISDIAVVAVFLIYICPFIQIFGLGMPDPFGPDAIAAAQSAPPGELPSLERLRWLPAYLVVALLVGSRWRAILAALDANRVLVGLMSLAVVSVFWSMHPEDTLRRSLALVFTCLFGVYLGARYEVSRWIELFGWALAIVVAMTVIYTAMRPDYATTSFVYPGAWRGGYAHKNGLGSAMLLGCITFGTLMLGRPRLFRWPSIAFAVALVLMLLSTSVTALMGAVASVAAAVIALGSRRGRRRFHLTVGLALALALLSLLLFVPSLTLVLHLFGKDPTFTGRTEIWHLVWAAIQARFWLGYGFGAFWIDVPSADNPMFAIWDVTGVLGAHNGLLDLWLSIGFIGVSLWVSLLVSTAAISLGQFAQSSFSALVWSAAYYATYATYTFSEGSTVEQYSISWTLLVAAAVSVRRVRRAHGKARTASGIPSRDGTAHPSRLPGLSQGALASRVIRR